MATMGYRLTAVMAVVVVAGTTAAGWHRSGPPGDAVSRAAPPSHHAQATGHVAAQAADNLPTPSRSTTPHPAATPSTTPHPAATPSPAIGPAARKSCPAAASACVDLTDHLTWLQAGGRITYGPVPMEPGPPGTAHATPRGTFHVQWKAGRNYISTEYHEPIPYAVFFAPGGIAFHAGSLTESSHGCVHLRIGSAKYYHDHLPVGAEVVVF